MVSKTTEEAKLALVLVRGLVNVERSVKDTLRLLHLQRKNHGVVTADTPTYRGMCVKVKDYITWGEISPEMYQELITLRGKESKGPLQDRKKKYSYAMLTVGTKHYLPYFRLNPPRKGFGRKGIKVAFAAGGALGYRGTAINDLIKRMV